MGLSMVWSILRNIGTVLDFFKFVKKLVGDIASRDVKIPTCDETKSLFEQVRKLLDSGIIDVPGIDEKEVAQVIGQIEDRLTCTIENVHKDLKKIEDNGVDLKGRGL